MTKLNYINWGVASRVGQNVYVNKRLNAYPKLRNALIRHENAHTDDFTMKDIFLDIEVEELKGIKAEYYKFIIQNPTSWVEFLPIKKYQGTVLFNLPLLFVWLLAGGLTWYVIANLI